MKITRAVVPNMFTVLNMFSGFMSIINSTQGNIILAGWFIILAAVFDALDGIMARITKTSSEFGVEFDSLSDIVSFGVAPAFLVYNVALYDLNTIGILISSFPMIFGGIRLARFNVELVGLDKDFYKGLPIPASAGLIVTYVLTFYDSTSGLTQSAANILLVLVVASSLLMVSSIKYGVLPKPYKQEIQEKPFKFATFFFAFIIVIATKGQALFYVFAIYTASGLVRFVVEKISLLTSKRDVSDESEDEPASIDA